LADEQHFITLTRGRETGTARMNCM